MNPGVPAAADVLEKVDALGPPGTPVTTPEVAEGFECTQRTIYNRLDSLVDDGVLETKKVGANSRVWWRPAPESVSNGGELNGATTEAPRTENASETRGGSADQRSSVAGDVEMAELIHKKDWSETPLGPQDDWPQSLQTLVETTLSHPFPTIILWGEELVQIYNDGYRIIAAGKHPEALGQPTRECWPEVWDINQPMYDRVLNEGESVTLEDQLFPILRKGYREEAYFTLSYSPVRDDSGEIAGVYLTIFETTERKEAEQALHESEERLNAFVTATSDVVYRMNPDWSEMYYLDGQGFVADTDEPRQTWLEEYIPDDEQERVMAVIEEAIETKSTFELEHQVVQTDGSRGWVHSRAVPMLDDDGEITEWFGTATDVTERKRRTRALEERTAELEEARTRLQVAAAAGSVGLYTVNVDEDRMIADSYVAECYGVDPDRAADGAPVDDFVAAVHEDDTERVLRDFETALAETGRLETEYRVRNRDGDVVWLLSRGTVEYDDAGNPRRLHGGISDISEQKHREKREQFLLALSDAIRPLSDPVEIQREAARVLGEELGADRVQYGDVLDDENTNVVHADYHRDDMDSLAGEHQLDAYGEYIAEGFRAGETLAVDDLETFSDLSEEALETCRQAQIRAWVGVPLIKDSVLEAFISVTESTVRAWTDTEVEMTEEMAERTWAAVERARAERNRRESEERYRTLFESIDEGFCIVEVLFDEDEPVDYRFLETNPAFEDQTGLNDAEGERMRALEPNHEEHWFETYGRIAQTGESERFTNRAAHLDDRWYDVYAFRIGAPEERTVAILFNDISERKKAEQELERQAEFDAFRVELLDAFQPLTDPVDIQEAASRLLGNFLDATMAYYYEYDSETGDGVVNADYRRDDGPRIVGRYTFDDFPEIHKLLLDGSPVVVTDTQTDSRLSPAERDQYDALDFRSYVAVPFLKDGSLTAVFVVGQSSPREWTESEISLARETAERTWLTVEWSQAEQARRESEERFRAVANLVPSLLWSNDPEGSTFWYNQQWLDYTGQTMEDAADYGWLNAIHPEDREQSLENFQSAVDAGEPLRQEHRIRRHDGEYHWFLVQARPVRDGGEISRWFGAATDIHDQREMRATLERLNDASQELIDADVGTIADRVAPLVREILSIEYAALWQYNEQTGNLEPSDTDSVGDADIETKGISSAFSDRLWQTFVGTDIDIQNETDFEGQGGLSQLHSLAFIPFGRYGVVCAGSTRPTAFDERAVDLIETLAATVETAWDRAESEAELAHRNEELTHLDRLNTLIRKINKALVAADTRDEIDDAVCERLADSDLYEFAWIGELNPVTDVVEPRAWAGIDSGYLEDHVITVKENPTDRDPIARAIRTGTLQVVSDIATDSRVAHWREATLERGARSLVSIPLVYDDAVYGVLTVYADRPQSDEDERNHEVLSELGDTIAHTINARETRETLQTDSVVELTLRFRDANTPLCRLARETDSTIDYQGFVPRSNGQADVFFIARGISPEELQATAARSLAFDDLECLTARTDGSLYRARVSDPPLAARITDEGAVVRSIAIEVGVATVVLDVPHTAAVREFLDRLREWSPDFELRARQSRERPLKARQTFVAALEDHLTDRQREVLQTAYLSGFFEVPRVSNGQEVTELLGISQPTFSEHLRAAERALCEVFFEAEPNANLTE